MHGIRRNGRWAALPAAIAVVIAIAVAAFFGGQIAPSAPSPPPALAQGAPTDVTARNGASIGQVVVGWTPAAGSQTNRVGWANETEARAATAAGNWREAFNFVDLGGTKRTYTVKRLEPEVRHAFIVATRRTTGGGFIYSSWVLLATTATPTPTPYPTPTPQPAATPCPTATPGQPPTAPDDFCPITGLPLGDGYRAVDETVSGPLGSYTLESVTYPPSVQVRDGGFHYPPGEGRIYARTCGTYRNAYHRTVFFSGGSTIMVDSDAGVGFFALNRADGSPSEYFIESGASRRLCQTWTLPATAETIIIPVSLGFDHSDIHLYRVKR